MTFRSIHLLTLLVFTIGCGTSDTGSVDESTAKPVRSETIRGPVTFVVEVAPGEVRLSDEPSLTLTVLSEPGILVTMPPFGESVGEFLIRDYHEPPPAIEADREVIRQVYTLEPTQAGTLTIDPITVRFQDNRADGGGQEYSVESEALNVDVGTVVGEAAPSLEDLKPSTGPVELPASGPPIWVWIAASLIVLALLAVIWLRRRRHDQSRAEQVLTPRQLAQRELNQIVSRRLDETDLKVFYVEVTGVVRRYIERTTGVRAAEQTTEEFLREILTGTFFLQEEQSRLRQFLESADLVKFAGHRPAPEDVRASIKRAREFIQLSLGQTEEAGA